MFLLPHSNGFIQQLGMFMSGKIFSYNIARILLYFPVIDMFLMQTDM